MTRIERLRSVRRGRVRPARLSAGSAIVSSRSAVATGVMIARGYSSRAACMATRPAACTARCSSSNTARRTTGPSTSSPSLRQPLGVRAHPSLEPECHRSEPFVQGRQSRRRVGCIAAPGRTAARRFWCTSTCTRRPIRDESEFRPALAARDGKPFEPGRFPTGSISSTTARIRNPNSSARSSRRSPRSPTSHRRTQGRDHRLYRSSRRA